MGDWVQLDTYRVLNSECWECFRNGTNENTSGCTGKAVQLTDAEHQIQVYIKQFEQRGWALMSPSALNPVIWRVCKSPCSLFEISSRVSRLKPNKASRANGVVPTHCQSAQRVCITKKHEPSLDLTQVSWHHKAGSLFTRTGYHGLLQG